MRPTPIERFMAKVEWGEKFDGTYCLLWRGAVSSNGYGNFLNQRPHRWLYERWVGPIPEGLVLDHLCRRVLCVNPMHLEPVTQLENVRRGLHGSETHCRHGHEFTPDNTRVRKNGSRACKTCLVQRTREWRARQSI